MAKKIKQKTRKSVARRIKITGSGKLLRRRGFARHLKAKKPRRKVRALKRAVEVRGKLARKFKRMLAKG